MKYIIVEGSNSYKLEKQVNSYLAEGWELYGHPYVMTTQVSGNKSPTMYNKNYHCQALIKKGEEDE